MARLVIFLCLVFCVGVLAEEDYAFSGKHFIASYYECEEGAIKDIEALQKKMGEAVEASGATILGSTMHHFLPDGLTLVFLLSESHASIHTYPEHGCCFIDLFTCGDTCSAKDFDQLLRKYLKPNRVEFQILDRN